MVNWAISELTSLLLLALGPIALGPQLFKTVLRVLTDKLANTVHGHLLHHLTLAASWFGGVKLRPGDSARREAKKKRGKDREKKE